MSPDLKRKDNKEKHNRNATYFTPKINTYYQIGNTWSSLKFNNSLLSLLSEINKIYNKSWNVYIKFNFKWNKWSIIIK